MQNDKLLSCPFCGGEDVRFGSVGNSLGIDNYIKCDSCGAKIQICEEYGIEKLKAKWNTRKPMERIVARLEEIFKHHSATKTVQRLVLETVKDWWCR